MSEPDYDAAIEYALARLRDELPPGLTYHNLWHTEHGVIPAVQRLAEACGIGQREQRLLAVAAAYHDIGFIEQYEDHEEVGVRLAARVLPRFGFGQADIVSIGELIWATCLRAQPEGRLQEMISDADLDVLGREDFLQRGEMLWREICTFSGPVSYQTWLEEQLRFQRQHRYYTPEARALRNEGKRRNINLLEQLIRDEAQQPVNERGVAGMEDEV